MPHAWKKSVESGHKAQFDSMQQTCQVRDSTDYFRFILRVKPQFFRRLAKIRLSAVS
jgi:hypothetical protein